ncbi:MAG: hypothetical protein AAGM67_02085 [Bacteroidota bacterium]
MKPYICLLVAFLTVSQLATAQVRRNAVEASQNQKAIAANKAQLERDLEELATFKDRVKALENAFVNKDAAKVASLKASLLVDMSREINQSEAKIAQDKREVSQSRTEANSSQRELNRSRVDRATPDNDLGDRRDVRDDRRDRMDDQRDAQDDRDDLNRQVVRTKRQKEIYALIQAFNFSFEPTLAQKAKTNIALLQEFSATMETDIAATKAEINEDKREAAEDGRERREDRREVRERRRN